MSMETAKFPWRRQTKILKNKKLPSSSLSASLSGGHGSDGICLEGDRLSAVDGRLCEIGGDIPAQIAVRVRSMFLSGNYLRSADGISQFFYVKVLSLSNNRIRYVDDIAELGRLPKLQKLSLTGNLVCRTPYYRETIITLCPELVFLDGARIDAVDRSKARLTSHKAKSVFEQLRLNELRNAVLVHGSKLLTCHQELRGVVGGKFRSVLGGHMGSSFNGDEGELFVPRSGAGCGVGSILFNAVQGGVFRWLQMSCIGHFNKLVQDHIFKLVSANKEWNLALEASAATPNDIASLWDSIIAEVIKMQQEYFLQLTEFCELSIHGNDGASSSKKQKEFFDAVDSEVLMDCIGRLHFVTANSSSAVDQNCRGSEESESTSQLQSRHHDYCGVGVSSVLHLHHNSNKISNYSQQASVNTSKSVTFADDNAVRAQSVNTAGSTITGTSSSGSNGDKGSAASATESRLPQSRQEVVHERYVTLLEAFHNCNTAAASAASSSSTVSNRGDSQSRSRNHQVPRAVKQSAVALGKEVNSGLSSRLPPQQLEPDDEVVIAKAAAATIVSAATPQLVPQRSLGSDATGNILSSLPLQLKSAQRLSSPEELDALIRRASCSLPQLRADYAQQKEDTVIRTLLLKYEELSADLQQNATSCRSRIDSCIGDAALSYSVFEPVAAASSMSELKQQVQTLSNLLAKQQRDAFDVFALHTALSSDCAEFEQRARALAAEAQNAFHAERAALAAISADIDFAQGLLPKYDQVFNDIDRIKAEIGNATTALSAERTTLSEERQEVQSALNYRSKLQHSLSEMQVALAATRREFAENPAVAALLRDRRNAELAERFQTTLRSHKRQILRMWRLHVFQQRKIRRYVKSRTQRYLAQLLRAGLLQWRGITIIAHRGALLMRWRRQRNAAAVFAEWKGEWRRRALHWPTMQQQLNNWRLRRDFRYLRAHVQLQRSERWKQQQREVYLQLFTVIRIFRAWKQQSTRARLRWLVAGELASLQQLRRCFRAIMNYAECDRVQLAHSFQQVLLLQTASLSRRCLRMWAVAEQFQRLLQHQQYAKFHFRRLRHRLLSLSIRRRRSCLLIGRALRTRTDQQLLTVFRWWRGTAAARKQIAHCATVVGNNCGLRSLHSTFAHWRCRQLQEMETNVRVDAVRRYRRYGRLQQLFDFWRQRCLLHWQLRGKLRKTTSTSVTTSANAVKNNQENGSLHLPLLVVNDERCGSSEIKRLVNASTCALSELDLQLLYLDDEDEREERMRLKVDEDRLPLLLSAIDEPIAASDYCVQLHRMIRRWSQRAQRLRLLRTCSRKLLLTRNRYTLGRAFSVAAAAWLTASRKRVQQLQSLVKADQDLRSNNTAQHEQQSDRRLRAESDVKNHRELHRALLATNDELMLATAELRSRLEEKQAAIFDRTASTAALSAEVARLNEGTNKLRGEITEISALREQHCSAFDPQQRVVTFSVASCNNSTVDDAKDDRMLLLNDVEVQYEKAVSCQESLLRQRQRIEIRLQSSHEAVAERNKQLQLADQELLRMSSARKQILESLESCRHELQQEMKIVDSRMAQFTKQIDAADREQCTLTERCLFLSRQHDKLTKDLEDIRKSTLSQQRPHSDRPQSSRVCGAGNDPRGSSVASSIDYRNYTRAKLHSLDDSKRALEYARQTESVLAPLQVHPHKENLSQNQENSLLSSGDRLIMNGGNQNQSHELYPANETDISREIDALTQRIKQRFKIDA